MSAQTDSLGVPRAELHSLYADLDAEIQAHQPVCVLSGRCCRFREYDHVLFVCAAEAAILLADAPPPVRPLDDGETCPWQDDRGHCQAREARPLGCRIYYCDPAFQPRMHEISERFHDRLKALVARLGLAWSYAPLHWHLREAAEGGETAAPAGDRALDDGPERALAP